MKINRTKIIIVVALIASVLWSYLWSQKRVNLESSFVTDDKSGKNIITIIDYSGRDVHITIPVKRIVSGYTAFTEILEAIGVGSNIVAATSKDADRLKIMSIGSHMKPDIEAVLASNPDFVLISSRRPAVVNAFLKRMSKMNIPVLSAHPTTVRGTLTFIENLGRITGSEKSANKLINKSKRILTDIIEKVDMVKESDRPLVFLEVRASPSLLSCGSDSVAYDIIRLAGGIPVCDLPGTVVRFDIEALVDKNPDVYIQQFGIMNRNPIDLKQHPVIGELDCIRSGRFYKIKEALLSRPGPHVVEAVEQVYKILYADDTAKGRNLNEK